MKNSKLFLILLFTIVLVSEKNTAQSESFAIRVVNESAEEIFTLYHPTSSFGSSKCESNRSKSGVKVILTIDYSGWIKSHRMKLEISFGTNGPTRIKIISDSNAFKSNKSSEALSILQEKWDELN